MDEHISEGEIKKFLYYNLKNNIEDTLNIAEKIKLKETVALIEKIFLSEEFMAFKRHCDE